MKKRTKVILGVVIGVLFLYSALMTFSLYMSAQEYNELSAELKQTTTDYEITKKEFFELHEKYQELVFENAIK